MNGSIQRRLTVAINWSAARIASLDDRERYEDSYALTEEFREWILCVDQHPELMADQVLMVPDFSKLNQSSGSSESDGLLEI
ncbi:hypothetical protein [Synechococcus sp. LA31]|jgi:hypothetical protein|uniref:hypothetical protein n=1 Tax=Synechococcaceae TaxID=1890426 RepID=UPI001BDD749A|nr:hypothetical protein [Synechococcus sp. LA31]QVV67723.1 hypothetical protein KJJ24_00440 [Synechococcus sp. LA31]